MHRTPGELYREREKRVIEAMALGKPDRVPIVPIFGSFAADYAGISRQDELYDLEKSFDASFKATVDFEPDMASSSLTFGPVLEGLDYRQLRWAGHGLPSDGGYQFVEGEYMKADEYDAFLHDPSDFIVRTYWPRIMGKLGAFGKLPPLRNLMSYFFGLTTGFMAFSTPEGLEALDALKKAGEESLKMLGAMVGFAQKVVAAGFPTLIGAATEAPFDALGDFLRGTRGIMLDMYRRPEKIQAACEKLLPTMLEAAIPAAQASRNPRVFIPLHKGAEGFMSLDQFKRFYWPTFKELLEALVGAGLNPVVLVEGGYTSRLDIIKDVPAGKITYWFEDVDMIKAKEALRERACIMGNVPMSLLVTGTPDQVRESCKKLIDTVGSDGGYIMSAAAIMDDSRPENVKTMMEFTREYGVY